MFCWFYTTLALINLPETLLAYFIFQSLIGGIVNTKHKDPFSTNVLGKEKKSQENCFTLQVDNL